MHFKILSLLFIFFLTNPVRANDIETIIANHPHIQLLQRNHNLRQQFNWLPSLILNLFLPIDDDALLLIETDFHEVTFTEFD